MRKGGNKMKLEVGLWVMCVGSLIGAVVDLFGIAVTVMFALMLLDYFAGLVTYAILGEFTLKKAGTGLIKKSIYFFIVAGAYLLGLVIPAIDFAGGGLATAFAVLEFISVVDKGYKVNLGLPHLLNEIIKIAKREVGEKND